MANLSLYVSAQTEQSDVTEFFQKGLMHAGENPVAFFEGVFYESHQERVGNIAFQDYLIYTDKAVYFWARGSNKDYLDRFNLGSVTVNSRNKDHDFATLNFKVRREDKDPVYVIFDMVELREAELIIKLHTVIESIIEERFGLNYRKNLPDDVSLLIQQNVRSICVPQVISLRFDAPDSPQRESHIGYGQDLLEQYKASIGYPSDDKGQQQGGAPYGGPHGGEHNQEGFSPADVLKGIENILPKDPASLKRIAGSIKEMIGDAPFKIRDQMKSDLQHVPGMLSALTELLNSIADNPQAERFVLNIVKTAVKNDGVIGSVGKLIKLSSSFSDNSKRKAQRPAPKADNSASDDDSSQDRHRDSGDVNDNTFRRKSIHITSDDEATLNDDCFSSDPFSGELNNTISAASKESGARVDDFEREAGMKRKKIAIKTLDENVPPIVKNMMSTDDSQGTGERASRNKIRIKTEEDDVLPAEKINSELLYEHDVPEKSSPDATRMTQDTGERVSRNKIRIKTEEDDVLPAEKINSELQHEHDVPEKGASDASRMTGNEADTERGIQ
jgi:hypothetical protein